MSHWRCDYDEKPLKFPFVKWARWPQYPFFTRKWLVQTLFGDNYVLRFHNDECERLYFAEGKMKEVVAQK